MNDAREADIRIQAATTAGNEITTELDLNAADYEEKFTTLGPLNSYLVSDRQLNRLEESYSIATDF